MILVYIPCFYELISYNIILELSKMMGLEGRIQGQFINGKIYFFNK